MPFDPVLDYEWGVGGVNITQALYWVGDTSTDAAVPANWSLTDGGLDAPAVPDSNDAVHFSSLGNSACTLTASVLWGSIDLPSGYTATLDLNNYNVTLASSGDATFTGGGTVDCGSGTIFIVSSTFDNSGQTTWTYGTSTLNVSGTSTLVCGTSQLYHLVIASSAAVSITDDLTCNGDLTGNGTVSITGGKTLTVAGNCVFNDDLTGVTSAAALTVTGTNVAHNATITNIDCSGGTALDATDNCVDGGGNTNVTFTVPVVTTESRLSPLGIAMTRAA